MNDDLQDYRKMYGLYLIQGGSPAPLFEVYCADVVVTEDDRRNEGALYRSAFRDHGREVWQRAIYPLIDRIRTKPFDPAMPEYVDLAFAQYMGAKALFQYRLEVMPQLKEFIRIFDQVGMDIEKKALWTWSRKG
jgi:hypothetical protein